MSHISGIYRPVFADEVVHLDAGVPLETIVGSEYDEEMKLGALLDKLRDCTDMMDRFTCDDLGLDHGSTYADGVRVIEEQRAEAVAA